MTSSRAAVFAVVAIAGCWTSSTPPPPVSPPAPPAPPAAPPRAPAHAATAPCDMAIVIADMVGFRDSMCRCVDVACADQITKEMARWGEEIAAQFKGCGDQASAREEIERLTELTTSYAECAARVMTQPGGATP